MNVTVLFDWTVEQYAIAAAEYKKKFNALPEQTLAGANILRAFWSGRSYEPGRSPIILNDTIDQERGYAVRLFHSAAIE